MNIRETTQNDFDSKRFPLIELSKIFNLSEGTLLA